MLHQVGFTMTKPTQVYYNYDAISSFQESKHDIL